MERIPPSAIDSEKIVLGAMLVDPSLIPAVTENLQASDFYGHVHQPIFSAITKLYDSPQPFDRYSVAQYLRDTGQGEKTGGLSYLSSLMDTVQTVQTTIAHAKIVREKAKLRALIAVGEKIQQIGFDGEDDAESAITDAESALFKAVHDGPIEGDGEGVQDIGRRIYTQLVKGAKESQLTPWPTLNRMTGGFFPGEFIAWPAAPKVGKSALINQLADFIGSKYGKVLYFPLEMGKTATVRRMLATYTSISSRRVRMGKLGATDYDSLMMGIDVLGTRNIHVFGRGKSVADIRRIAQRHAMDGPVAAIIVDHPGFLRDLESGKQSKHEKLDSCYRALLEIADSLPCVMHVVQHVNRAGMAGKPTLAHIRDGGNIEGHAHVIVAPYRENPDSNDPDEQRCGEFLILANRDGESGFIPGMQFLGSRHLWLEADQHIPNYFEEVA